MAKIDVDPRVTLNPDGTRDIRCTGLPATVQAEKGDTITVGTSTFPITHSGTHHVFGDWTSGVCKPTVYRALRDPAKGSFETMPKTLTDKLSKELTMDFPRIKQRIDDFAGDGDALKQSLYDAGLTAMRESEERLTQRKDPETNPTRSDKLSNPDSIRTAGVFRGLRYSTARDGADVVVRITEADGSDRVEGVLRGFSGDGIENLATVIFALIKQRQAEKAALPAPSVFGARLPTVAELVASLDNLAALADSDTLLTLAAGMGQRYKEPYAGPLDRALFHRAYAVRNRLAGRIKEALINERNSERAVDEYEALLARDQDPPPEVEG